MKIKKIESTLSLKQIKDAIVYGNSKALKKSLRGHVVTLSIEGLRYLDLMILAESRECRVLTAPITNSIKNLSKDSFSLLHKSQRFESIVDNNVWLLVKAYHDLIEDHGISEYNASYILPLSLKNEIAVTFAGYDILKILKYSELCRLILGDVNKEIELDKLISTVFEQYLSVLRKQRRSRDTSRLDQDINNINRDNLNSTICLNLDGEYNPAAVSNSITTNVYIQNTVKLPLFDYIQISLFSTFDLQRCGLRTVHKKIYVPEEIRTNPDALKLFNRVTKKAIAERNTLPSQNMMDELYLLCEVIDVSVGGELVNEVPYINDIEPNHGVFSEEITKMYLSRYNILLSHVDDKYKKVVNSSFNKN